MIISSILCPVDFSEHSERALLWASALASAYSAHLTILTVNDPLLDAAARASGASDQLRQQTQDDLRTLLQKAQPDGGYSSWTMPAVSVEVGDPADVILAQAADCRSDLVVMGTQGLGGAKKLLFGSTAERVLRLAAVPVLAVPAGPSRIARVAGGTQINLNRVLAPVDVNHVDIESIAVAGAWARKFNVPARLITVVAAAPVRAFWQDATATQHATRVGEARAALDGLAGRLGEAVQAECEVKSGRPAEEITRDAVEHGCGLIVMGSGAQHRPGATAYRVLAQSDVPVLVVPPAI